MEWQREQWMAQRECALKRDSKGKIDEHTATKESCTTVKAQKTDEIEKEVDDLLDWVGEIDVDFEEAEQYDLDAVKQGGGS